MVVFADRANLNTAELFDLLSEKILSMQAEENISDTVKKVLGCDFDVDSYPAKFTKDNEQPKNAIALFPKNIAQGNGSKIFGAAILSLFMLWREGKKAEERKREL